MKDTGVKIDNKTPLLNFENLKIPLNLNMNLGHSQKKAINGMTVQLLNLVVTVVRKVVLIIMMKVALMTIATLIMTKLVTLNSTYLKAFSPTIHLK